MKKKTHAREAHENMSQVREAGENIVTRAERMLHAHGERETMLARVRTAWEYVACAQST